MKNLFGVFLVVAVFAGWTQGGCYNPDIQQRLSCSPSGKKCPDGFECGVSDNLCWKMGAGSGGNAGGGKPGTGGAGGTISTGGNSNMGGVIGVGGVIGNGGVIGSGGANMCVGPFPVPQCNNSATPPGTCDPVCQSGCACKERCNILGGEKVACVPPTGDKKPGENCTLAVDNCTPGLICLGEFDEQKCGQHCYRHCRADNDCLNRAHCTIELTSATDVVVGRVCDNPPEDCSPMFGAANCVTPGRPFPNFGCYIAGSQFSNEAVCDCAGSTDEDKPCTFERECKPGLICAAGAGGQPALCRKVCPSASTPAAQAAAKQICGLSRKCVPFHNSPRFGFCEPIR